jgi:UDP-N-acetylmuramoyl-L-alanyl-D-glutamate--2,6-diaminopimelate ligase
MVRAHISRQLSVRMTLLLDDVDVLETSGDPGTTEVLGIEHDSRRVAPGDLFCCLPGGSVDGHDFAGDAVERGAAALLCEHPVVVPLVRPVLQVRVAEGAGRPSMARAAAAFYGHPSDALLTAGVTGTSGKTTVVHLLGAVLEHAGHPATVVGTMTGARTTPEATDLQRLFAEVRDAHLGETGPRPAVAMEVSSHALVQSRVEGIRFDVAVFTNLSHEHLDFHGTMDAYFAAKATLFDPARAAAAVVNVDDEWGSRLASRVEVPTVAVRASELRDVRLDALGSRFVWRGRTVTIGLTGFVNVRNAQLAAEAAVALGVAPGAVAAGLEAAGPVPGRMEVLPTGDLGFTVLVDYAHKPGALEAALRDARRLAARGGRVVVVFGCGGDRDPSKRPRMGAVADQLADVVVITSDNPRSEDPLAVIADVRSGMSGPATVEPDRRSAIRLALREASQGDVVLVEGKGHETTQVFADRAEPFDDRAVVAEELSSITRAAPRRH